MQFGIIQGRLTQAPKGVLQWFPEGCWEEEFPIAASLGYQFIELISEREHNVANPLWTNEGIAGIQCLIKENNLISRTICEDYVIGYSLLDDKKALDHVFTLIERSALLRMEKFILPLFEKSDITSENFLQYIRVLKSISDAANDTGLLICLETNLEVAQLMQLISNIDRDNIRCVYDTGNRIIFKEDIYSDIRLLGDRIQHVHIKDRDSNNNNVLLGTGRVDFCKVFQALNDINYTDTVTFETCRGRRPIETAKYNLDFVHFFIEEVEAVGG